ncbi:elongator complex protein 5-like [Oppia nitens]|uniref:elongator complex protein 5-like n=1 Tax=Oppia nitens TaxID=1686743 RepID=UPI0023DBEF2C|nr:elongator complex protein 5-like [Oppia nitens]
MVAPKLVTKLVTSVDSSPFILIGHRLTCDVRPLVVSLIHNRLKQVNVALVCIENSSQVLTSDHFLRHTSDGPKREFKVIDLYAKYHTIDSDVCQHLLQAMEQLSDDYVVVIDSLTPIILMDQLYQTNCLLYRLFNRFKQLICILHEDCHSQHITESIEQLSHSVIHLSATEDKTFKAIIRHRKPHRKTHFCVQQSMEFFTIIDYNIIYSKDNNNESKYMPPMMTTSQTATDPTLNIPFNLTLKDSELEAKNNLLLPYIKTHEDTKVFYEYDKNDDIDEEDPDEDLDI